MACPPLDLDGPFVAGALAFVDCQASTIGAAGYEALAGPGGIVALILGGLLTLFVAGFGFRMLMGETPGLRDGVGAVAKIAFVLALATAWAPYRTLVYDVALRGPAEIAGAIGARADLPGTGGDLADRLDLVDQALIQLNGLGVGRQAAMQNRQVVGSDQIIVEPVGGNPDPIEPYAFALARIVFLVGAVGAFAAVRLVAGLLLALGPLFVALALFDTTRGLFEGWVRALAAAFLGGVATTVVLASELAMSESWVADLLTQRLANAPIKGAAIELVVVAIVFDLVLVAGLAASARVATAFRLPALFRPAAPAAVRTPPAALMPGVPRVPSAVVPAEQPSRARAVADGVAALQRREAASSEMARRSIAGTASPAGAGSTVGRPTASSLATAAATPLGQARRRTRPRVSASAGRRDTRS